MSYQYSIVLPIKIEGNSTVENLFFRIGLPSYFRYLDRENLEAFYIIAPEKEIPKLSSLLVADYRLPFVFISDETVLGISSVGNTHSGIAPSGNTPSGWFKQQLIKLKMSSIVKTPYYLVLDSDHYLTKPISSSDFFVLGKIKMQSEYWQNTNGPEFSVNSNWWTGSAKLLAFDEKNLVESKYPLMGVTPQLLITNFVTGLIYRLEKLYGLQWSHVFVCSNATEFTAYWIYILQNRLTDFYELSESDNPIWRHDLDRNILNHLSPQQQVEKIRRSFIDSKSYFGVNQSYLQLDIESICNEAKSRLYYDAVFLSGSMLTPSKRLFFSVEERLAQTKKTIESIKKRIPNSFCILIEGSVLTDEQRTELKAGKNKIGYDLILEYGSDETILPFVRRFDNVGIGEMKLLEKGVEYLQTFFLPKFDVKYIFKLGARYELTDSFDLWNYNTEKFGFRAHVDTAYNWPVYTTGLYSIPVSRVGLFKEALITGQTKIATEIQIERLFYTSFPSDIVERISVLGLSGRLSYNGSYFEI
jgi:hypothetical protein